MKQRILFLIASLLLMVASVQTALAQKQGSATERKAKMVVTTMDNQVVKFDVSNVKDVTFEEPEPIIDEDHEFVDLGLPSGTLWATCNVGANSPEEYGDYFAWGETTPKDTCSWENYKYCNGTKKTLTKYCNDSSYGYNGFTDTLTELLPEDDAATANWGSDWQMPSFAQIFELCRNTTAIRTTVEDVNGWLFTASNGNSIFLPAAGYHYGAFFPDVDEIGYYWSRSLSGSPRVAYKLDFNSFEVRFNYLFDRYCGLSVRPVRKQ